VLSAEQVKKLLPSGRYDDRQAEEIKEGLHQLATILVSRYLKEKRFKKDEVKK
jgi:hypothetical protein